VAEFELLDAATDLAGVAFFVVLVLVGAEVADFVASGVLLVLATAVGVGALIAPPPIAKESVDENCGGVIAMTAPRPPRVPPAINNARFISTASR
jgi:hypothetical protein